MNSSDPSSPVPVAIIGMGCMFPQAEDLARYWNNILNGVDAITEVPESHWRPADYYDSDPKASDRTYVHRGGFLTPVDFPLMEFGISPHSIEATDTTQLLGLLVARQALDDAGCHKSSQLDRDRVSVILGVTGTLELVIPLGARLGHPIWRRALKAAGVDEKTTEDVVQRIASSYVGWQENSFPGLLGNVAAGRIANRLDLRGTNCVVDAACASSLAAVNLAMLELAAGRCDLAVSGGLDTFNDIFMYMCFSKTPALSPTGDARPFDAEADGTILGEGLGVLVLKRLADARRDGDRIYAVIRSVGSSSDGKGQAVYAPSAGGQVKALRQAYESAGISPSTIELIEAHGTGTKVGDATELAALEEVYDGARDQKRWCALGSVKSQVGHTKAAAGAAGLIKAALALHNKVLPPTCKVSRPIAPISGERSAFYLASEARPWLPSPGHPRRAAVSAFGFGGSNFHCVLEEAGPEKPGIDWNGDVQILAFSADHPEEIGDLLRGFKAPCDWANVRAEGARSRSRFRPDHPYRLLLVVERGKSDLNALVAAAQRRLESTSAPDLAGSGRQLDPGPGGNAHGRVVWGTGPSPGRLAMLFPGQGSQYVGMLRDLACRFPRMQAALARMNEVAGDQERHFSDWIYPRSSFGDNERRDQEQALRDTRFAQPAIGAVSLGLLRIFEEFGIRPDLVGGHSFGELTALCAAGRLDDRELAILARRRGELMAECPAQGGSGAMLAVFAPLDRVLDLLREQALDVVVANKNAPRQCVLSGPAAEIERAKQTLSDRKIATHPVPVSAAFHSRFVAHAQEPFQQLLNSITPMASTIPVFSNGTAEPYPEGAEQVRALLTSQLARPVEFVAQIEAMYRAGARTFLEVGPDAKLTGLVHAILEGHEHHALASDASRGRSGNLYDLGCSLATLAALGYAVDLNRWDEGAPGRSTAEKKAGLTVKICGANARPKERPEAEPRTQPGGHPAQAGPRPKAGEFPKGRAHSEPTASSEHTAAPRPPRFSMARDKNPAMSTHPQPRHHSEIDRTMNLPERMNSHRTNGQAASHHPGQGLSAVNHDQAAQSQPPLEPIKTPTGLSWALQNAQDGLLALQRLAEQTAELHRQFLEGQQKTQQTFLKLLEHQQRLSLAVLDSTEPPASSRHDQTSARETPANSSPILAPAKRQLPLDSPDRDHEKEPRVAALTRPSTPVDSVALTLIEVVAQKTGYPAEVLDLDMQLDADLGIDSIKRVEILSALQDRLTDLPPFQPEQLGSFRSLRAILEYIGQAQAVDSLGMEPAGSILERASDDTAENRKPKTENQRLAGSALERASDRPDFLALALLEAVAEKTGYPVDMLELDMRLDADLGIDSIKRVEIFSAIQDKYPETPRAGPEEIGTLGTLRDIVAFLGRTVAEPPAPDIPSNGVCAPMGSANNDQIARVLLEAVAEKTGYPVDMLELDMRLDADLGIDSIKRVEILSAVQDRLPEAPTLQPEQLGTLATLRQIVESLAPTTPCPAPTSSAPDRIDHGPRPVNANGVASKSASENGVAPHGAKENGVAVVGPIVLRRLHPRPAPLEAPDNRPVVKLRAGGTIWITDDGSPLTEALRSVLLERGYRSQVIKPEESAATTSSDHLCGVIILAARDHLADTFSRDAFRIVRAAAPALERSGLNGGAALVTVSRLDGSFGVNGLAPEISPASGALAGIAKTAGQEWANVYCKAIDLDYAFNSPEAAAGLIVEEMLRRGPAEVGLTRQGRTVLKLEPMPKARSACRQALRLERGDVVAISGGARGITAEVAVALAESFQPRLVILGRSPAPVPEADWLAEIHDESELKRALLERFGRSRTPRELGEHARQIMAEREVRRTLARIEAAGSPVVYRSVDVRDGAAVRAVLESIRREFGTVRGLIHGAGVLADRRITDQTDSQFELVYDTKVKGLHQLLEAIDLEALGLLVLFSSSTARFGRVGQVAYAAANEALNKWAQQLSLLLPRCRVVSYNWGPWAGGMVKEALRPLFEKEGLTLIPPAAGAQLVVNLAQDDSDGPVEIVVLAEHQTVEGSGVWGVGCGERRPLTPEAFLSLEGSGVSGVGSGERRPLTPEAFLTPLPTVHSPHLGTKLETVLRHSVDIESLPILNSHIIDGHPVLPMAIILEWLAEGAIQRNPGLVVSGLDNLVLYKGVILSDLEAVRVEIKAGKAVRSGREFTVLVELWGTLANGREVTHARAEVILADRHATGSRKLLDGALSAYPLTRDEIYQTVLFHGAAMQGIERVEGLARRAVAGWVSTAPSPSEWVERPLRSTWLTDPLAIDCAFQLVVLWCRDQLGANSLPTALGGYRQFRREFPADGVRVQAEIRQASDTRAVADIEFLDARGELVARLDSYECVIDSSLNQAFLRNQLAPLLTY